MVKIYVTTSAYTLDISVLFDVVEVVISALLGLDVLDKNNLVVDNVTKHLWNRKIANKDLFRIENVWKIKLYWKGDHLYVPISTPIQLLRTIEKLRKLHEQFAR